MDEERSAKRKGCIRTSNGPWKVRRPTKDGKTVTRYRYPSERERQKNRERERRRRTMSHNIFAGLRAHGNFDLPKHADTNDLLMALCHQAGWDVKDDGTISRKNVSQSETSTSSVFVEPPGQVLMEDEGYCNCNHQHNDVNNNDSAEEHAGQQLGQIIVTNIQSSTNVDLSLSL